MASLKLCTFLSYISHKRWILSHTTGSRVSPLKNITLENINRCHADGMPNLQYAVGLGIALHAGKSRLLFRPHYGF